MSRLRVFASSLRALLQPRPPPTTLFHLAYLLVSRSAEGITLGAAALLSDAAWLDCIACLLAALTTAAVEGWLLGENRWRADRPLLFSARLLRFATLFAIVSALCALLFRSAAQDKPWLLAGAILGLFFAVSHSEEGTAASVAEIGLDASAPWSWVALRHAWLEALLLSAVFAAAVCAFALWLALPKLTLVESAVYTSRGDR
jgi:hypothetical protein